MILFIILNDFYIFNMKILTKHLLFNLIFFITVFACNQQQNNSKNFIWNSNKNKNKLNSEEITTYNLKNNSNFCTLRGWKDLGMQLGNWSFGKYFSIFGNSNLNKYFEKEYNNILKEEDEEKEAPDSDKINLDQIISKVNIDLSKINGVYNKVELASFHKNCLNGKGIMISYVLDILQWLVNPNNNDWTIIQALEYDVNGKWGEYKIWLQYKHLAEYNDQYISIEEFNKFFENVYQNKNTALKNYTNNNVEETNRKELENKRNEQIEIENAKKRKIQEEERKKNERKQVILDKYDELKIKYDELIQLFENTSREYNQHSNIKFEIMRQQGLVNDQDQIVLSWQQFICAKFINNIKENYKEITTAYNNLNNYNDDLSNFTWNYTQSGTWVLKLKITDLEKKLDIIKEDDDNMFKRIIRDTVPIQQFSELIENYKKYYIEYNKILRKIEYIEENILEAKNNTDPVMASALSKYIDYRNKNNIIKLQTTLNLSYEYLAEYFNPINNSDEIINDLYKYLKYK